MIRNMGKIDRISRFVVALVLLWAGLFPLQGLEGDITGLVVTMLSLMPFFTSTTAFCPLFKWTGIHTLSKRELAEHGDPNPVKEADS